MPYIENPKTEGSGIVGAIPQTGRCPVGCDDCFFQSGRSYLEPLDEHLPNMPDPRECNDRRLVVRMNDGNDSNVDRNLVIDAARKYMDIFFNTSIPIDIGGFPMPVAFTINPGKMTDVDFYKIDHVPSNLMLVRFRANTWNVQLMNKAIAWYTSRNVPVVLTFMNYYKYEGNIPKEHVKSYTRRVHSMNEYLAITTASWRRVMAMHEDNILVSSCGKIEGEKGKCGCKFCGNCLREYFATRERMRNEGAPWIVDAAKRVNDAMAIAGRST